MHLGPDLFPQYEEPFEEEESPACPGENFYAALEKELADFTKSVATCSSLVLRPSFIVGPSPRIDPSVNNLALCLGIYATLCAELHQPLKFLGGKPTWHAKHTLSHSDRIADLALRGSSELERGSCMALNAGDSDAFSFEEIWPQLAEWAGCPWEGPQGNYGISLAAALETDVLDGTWAGLANREALREPQLSRLWNGVFLEASMSTGWDARLSSKKATALGWAAPERQSGWPTFLRALCQLQEQRLLPS